MSLTKNASNLSNVSNVVTDAVLKGLVKMSPLPLPYLPNLTKFSESAPENGKLVVFVGYTEEENMSILKTLSEYVLGADKLIYAVGSENTDMLVSDDFVQSLVDAKEEESELDYIFVSNAVNNTEDLLDLVVETYCDYVVIESVSLIKNATLPDIVSSLRKLNIECKANTVITMSNDEYASVSDILDLGDIVVIAEK